MTYEYGNWFLVAINIGLFGYFMYAAFKPKTKTDWKTFGSFGAFIIALFAEMYGFPLTIYLLTSYFGSRLGLDFSHTGGHLFLDLLGVKGDPHFNPIHIISNILLIGGLLLLGSAWNDLYNATKNGVLATSGAYRFMRHPQYTAFMLVIAGFLLQWPTIITLLMAPVLIVRYVRLAYAEEQEVLKKFGEKYRIYQRTTPGFIPSAAILSGAWKQDRV